MNNSYDNQSDEQIIQCIRQGNSDAVTYILNKYKGLVRATARGLYLIGGESDDLIQEGMIGLFEAIENYKPDKDTSFYSFARLCISRQMYSAISAAARKKHTPLNSYISLDPQEEDDGQALFKVSEIKVSSISAEDMVLDRERTLWIEEKIQKVLSPLERKVLELFLKGNSYSEIASTLDKEPKSIDNALQRIKNKIKKIIK